PAAGSSSASSSGSPAGSSTGSSTLPPAALPIVTALAKQYTEHVGRLTNTPLNDAAAIGLKGTDLGVSFERDGKLLFLFGDSWTTDGANWNDDSVAWVPAAPPAAGTMPQLAWFLEPPTPARSVLRLLQLPVPSIDPGRM